MEGIALCKPVRHRLWSYLMDKCRGILSECYFAGKGAALVLPPNERLRPSRRVSASGSDIQQHLQSMFYLLRPEETLKMAVKLESVHAGRTRYLVVVSCIGRQDAEESCLLGIDCNEKTTVGLVLRVLADTSITLDGDGGFSVSVCGRHHIFKPVSVQAMWSALQTLHKVSFKAREQNYFQGGLTHDWVSYYEQRIESDRSCLNEWHAMDNLESRRPPSPDSVRTKPREREETERVIRSTLKEIMMSVDLDEVTSKYIRGRLEEDLDMDLGEFKPFIDQEMLTILGQMDAATEVFDHVYLGSEWNASNLEELQKNGVGHILNVTREIDNFFPGMFIYQNIRVYDDEKTDLLKHWDDTFKYITNAKKEGSKVLVHCKMGVSRSASVVIAYAMKAYNWDYKKAFEYVKHKRNCIKPNTSFISQLETYQGILDAMKNREKLQRSKSENNLKSPGVTAKVDQSTVDPAGESPVVDHPRENCGQQMLEPDWSLRVSGQELGKHGGRPKSWSPDNSVANAFFTATTITGPASVSLEQLNLESVPTSRRVNPPLKEATKLQCPISVPEPNVLETGLPTQLATVAEARNYRMPCGNGQAYSVSPNKVVHLPASCSQQKTDCSAAIVSSVKHRVNELESQSSQAASAAGRKPPVDRKGLVLNLTSQFESSNSKPASPVESEADCGQSISATEEEEEPVLSQTKLGPQMLTAVLVKKEIWDPGEKESPTTCAVERVNDTSTVANGDSLVWTSSSGHPEAKDDGMVFISELKLTDSETGDCELSRSLSSSKLGNGNDGRPVTRKEVDPFSTQLDRVFDREERRQQRPVPVLPACTIEVPTEVVSRECPSRQSSWSSYDSAVVLGYQGEARDAPSRQSSWGSGDTRWTYGGMLPSRNSSWGSYDMRPPVMQNVNEISEKDQQQLTMEDLFGSSSSGMFPYDRDEYPWYPGTVKRTKQKLEEGTNTVKRVCSDSPQRSNSSSPPSNINLSHSVCRLSDSATVKNVKIHGPRPYQSPTAERLLSNSGFTFPSSGDHQQRDLCASSEKSSDSVMIPYEAQNPALIHYASSPTLCSHQGILSTSPPADKMATSQPNITFLDSADVAGDDSTRTSAISREAELSSLNLFSSSLPESACPLSVSAPTTSMSNMMDNIVTLTSPSCSLPTVSLRCLNSVDFVVNESCDSVHKTTSPSIVHTTQCASVKHQKKVLENLNNISKKKVTRGDTTETFTKDALLSRFSDVDTQKSRSGLVKNLKKEFEAKSVLKSDKTTLGEVCVGDTDTSEQKSKRSDSIKIRSFPSSPVSVHPDCKSSGSLSPSNTTEDLSVKMLVGKYEISKTTRSQSPEGSRTRFVSESENVQRRAFSPQQSSIPHRKSSLDMPNVLNNAQTNKHSLHVHNLKNGSSVLDTKERPPVPAPTPSVVVASVMAKAASKKQQQGKTHPLTRLTIGKPRHNNPVYNTM
ncbi:protein phosphatase Slingshot isoform X3 [Anabrus simplex]|uniref:protein phosphatase Slingshot isoform X3 n=1 Tax=Anabrus simplex TaxID=316456 RepID=UPI0035A3027D